MSNVQMLDYLLLFCAKFHIHACVKRKWGPYADVRKAVVIHICQSIYPLANSTFSSSEPLRLTFLRLIPCQNSPCDVWRQITNYLLTLIYSVSAKSYTYEGNVHYLSRMNYCRAS